jgi:N-dimethylarginine dimethylaminohydrolase
MRRPEVPVEPRDVVYHHLNSGFSYVHTACALRNRPMAERKEPDVITTLECGLHGPFVQASV